ncbi:MAG: hypothetical protein JOS17DRAFT_764858 [Linnemannia elongata]|nr:MAG: hypothetical protein JOS17DRAFT_764858 [Linnemannia elongata]
MAPVTSNINMRVLRVKNTVSWHALNESYFKIHQEPKPDVQDGDILVRTLYIGLDPFNGLQFVGPSDEEVAEPLRGYGLGEVVETKNSQFQVGELVFGISITWDTYSLQKNPSNDLIIVPRARELAQQGKVPLSAYMGILGMPGLTGYQSLELYGNLKAGQTIFVSSAAGGVGQAAVQFAKLKGVKVIGSAGSQDKVDYLKNTLGLDYVINYKTQDIRIELDRIAPQGVDLFLDLVGSEMFDVALEKTKRFGRVLTLGIVASIYHDGPAPGESAGAKTIVNDAADKTVTTYTTKNLPLIITKELQVNGLNSYEHYHTYPQFWAATQELFAEGKIRSTETVVDGLESVPKAYAQILTGQYQGKVVAKVADL